MVDLLDFRFLNFAACYSISLTPNLYEGDCATMTHPLFDLGRVAILSGAASGMGRITSLGFAEVGADVVIARHQRGRRAGDRARD